MKAGKIIQAPKANVMAVTNISPARIPQSNDEFHQISLPSKMQTMFELGNLKPLQMSCLAGNRGRSVSQGAGSHDRPQ
jgi:hypothetical protein